MIALNAKMPMVLFSLKDPDNILKAARGEPVGTTITTTE
jgi:uridylate kinase